MPLPRNTYLISWSSMSLVIIFLLSPCHKNMILRWDLNLISQKKKCKNYLQAPRRRPELALPNDTLVTMRNAMVSIPDIASPAEYACHIYQPIPLSLSSHPPLCGIPLFPGWGTWNAPCHVTNKNPPRILSMRRPFVLGFPPSLKMFYWMIPFF